MNFKRKCFFEGRKENDKFSLSLSRGYMTIGKNLANSSLFLYDTSYFSFQMEDCEELLGILQEALQEMKELE